jgi:hypothetical protein
MGNLWPRRISAKPRAVRLTVCEKCIAETLLAKGRRAAGSELGLEQHPAGDRRDADAPVEAVGQVS